MPDRLGWRVLLGLLVGGALIFGLQEIVSSAGTGASAAPSHVPPAGVARRSPEVSTAQLPQNSALRNTRARSLSRRSRALSGS